MDPVFLDSQIENITIALQKITDGVPCIHFRFVVFFLPKFGIFVFSNESVDISQPHLLFTNMGFGGSPPHLCYSLVGRLKTGEQGINLGQEGCLAVGRIMHETMHALGKKVKF